MSSTPVTSRAPDRAVAAGSTPLSYQEILRTLGTLLEQQGTPRAVLTLAPGRAEVLAPNWQAPRVWNTHDLRREMAAQRQRRGQPKASRALRSGGLAQRLRAVGIALDCVLGSDLYVLTVDADGVQVHGRGYQHSFDEHQLARRLALASHLRGQGSVARTPSPGPAKSTSTEATCLVR
jgi:hypothetical protein